MEQWIYGVMIWRHTRWENKGFSFFHSIIPAFQHSNIPRLAEVLKEIHLGVVWLFLSGAVARDFGCALGFEFSLFKVAKDFVGAI